MQMFPFPARELSDELRDYQRDAIFAVHAHASEGAKRVLIVMATGGGKTAVATSMAGAFAARTLWLAHREELIDQAVDAFGRWYPGVSVGKITARSHQADAHIVVATVQSLRGRLDRTPGPFDLIVVDEAHHVAAPTYQQILDHYCGTEGLLPGSDPPADAPLVVGITATPDRTGEEGVVHRFFRGRIAIVRDAAWLIGQGYLCDLITKAIELPGLDLDGVEVRHGDFADGKLGKALVAAGGPRLIVDAWLSEAADRRTIVFAPTVEMSELVAGEFRSRGVTAEHVDGGTARDDRRASLARFRSGESQVLTNCAIATEGFDIPEVDCVLMARPTKSRILYSQAIGRGLRIAPGKADCLVLDVTGVSRKHKVTLAADLLGLHKALEAGASAKAALARQHDEESPEGQRRHEEQQSWDFGPARFAQVDAFGRAAGMKYVWAHEPIAGCVDRWTHTNALGAVVIRRGAPTGEGTGLWVAGVNLADGGPLPIHSGPMISDAIVAAEAWIDGTRPKGAWRFDPVTAKQAWVLRRAGWTQAAVEKLTKGQAGAEIGRVKAAERAGQRYRPPADALDVSEAQRRDAKEAQWAAHVTADELEARLGERRIIRPTDVWSLFALPDCDGVTEAARRACRELCDGVLIEDVDDRFIVRPVAERRRGMWAVATEEAAS